MLHAPSDRLSLKWRVLGAGAWSVGGYGLSQVLRFGGNLLITRLLMPDMFGVMAIANVVMTGLALFSDVGLLPNVVQNARGNDPAFLNTAWLIQMLRGAALWFIALGVSLFLMQADRIGLFPTNSVYADPRLPYVLAVSSFTAVIGGVQSTKLLEASRNLLLRRATLIDIAAQLAGLLCIVVWASIHYSIWALVSGGICSALTKAFLSHAWLDGNHNRLGWDKTAFNEIIHFGKWIFVSSILGFFAINGDRLLLGFFFSPTILGIYTIAYYIIGSIDQMMTKIIVDVSFPALSEISRHRPAVFKASYNRFHSAVASLAYFAAGMLMSFGQSLISLLYDPRYHAAGWMLEILAVILLTEPFRLATQCFLIFGAPQTYARIHGMRLIGLLLCLPVGFYLFGLSGALWGIVLSVFLSLPLIILLMKKYGLFDIRREMMMAPLFGAGIVIGKVFSLAVAHVVA
jgi:O-antigen/teichoic acid export membrane protein